MHHRVVRALGAISAGLILGLVGCAGPSSPPIVNLPSGFDIESHAGGRDARPANTLPAFAYSLAVGVTTLELDTQITADGVLVVRHNTIIPWYEAKNSWGKFLVADEQPDIRTWNLDNLNAFDLGAMSPHAPFNMWESHGETQKQVPGTSLATLEQVFQLVKDWGNDEVFLNIETKSTPYPDDPNAVSPQVWVSKFYDVVKKYGMQDRVMLQSFDWRTLVEMHRVDPGIALVALTSNQPDWNSEGDEGDFQWLDRDEPSPWMAGIDLRDFGGDVVEAAHSIGASVFSTYHREVTPAVIAKAHSLGMRVVPFTVNDPDRMKELIEMGVDGLITDRPQVLRQVCSEAGIPVPAPDPNPTNKPYFTGLDGL